MSDIAAARLMLITPVLHKGTDVAGPLAAALAAGDIACVLLRHAARDEREAKALVKTLAPLIQEHGAALLVEGDPRLAAHVQADGVHMAAPGEPLVEAVERLKPDRIVGCAGLGSRDDAMRVGEMDVDYLMFGEARADGSTPDAAWTLERVGWWAEIFNIPCVGYAHALAEVEPLALAGAEFVALGEAVFADPRGPAAAVTEAMTAIGIALRERRARLDA
jgi:thiamine-phosphate pyrophosphorylase